MTAIKPSNAERDIIFTCRSQASASTLRLRIIPP
jgi:hypothetical protein